MTSVDAGFSRACAFLPVSGSQQMATLSRLPKGDWPLKVFRPAYQAGFQNRFGAGGHFIDGFLISAPTSAFRLPSYDLSSSPMGAAESTCWSVIEGAATGNQGDRETF